MTRSALTFAAAGIVLLLSLMTLVWRATGAPSPAEALATRPLIGSVEPLLGVPLMGDPDAPLVMVEFADFQCSYCSRFARDVLPALKADYVVRGKLLLGFRTWVVGGESDTVGIAAAAAASCAAEQGRFWDIHDRLFQTALRPEREGVLSLAAELAIDVEAMDRCLTSFRADTVRATSARAASHGLHGTPAFLIGRREIEGFTVLKVLVGMPEVAGLREVLDGLIADIGRTGTN